MSTGIFADKPPTNFGGSHYRKFPFKDEVRERLGDFRKSYQNLMFLFPFNYCMPPTFLKKHAAKKEFNQRVWNKILNIKPVWHKFQEHGSTFYLNIDYR